MHTVERLEQAIALAQRLGFVVRQDWFGGAPAGACEVKGRRWLFLDLALSPAEQLERVVEGIQQFAAVSGSEPYPELVELINLRKAA